MIVTSNWRHSSRVKAKLTAPKIDARETRLQTKSTKRIIISWAYCRKLLIAQQNIYFYSPFNASKVNVVHLSVCAAIEIETSLELCATARDKVRTTLSEISEKKLLVSSLFSLFVCFALKITIQIETTTFNSRLLSSAFQFAISLASSTLYFFNVCSPPPVQLECGEIFLVPLCRARSATRRENLAFALVLSSVGWASTLSRMRHAYPRRFWAPTGSLTTAFTI